MNGTKRTISRPAAGPTSRPASALAPRAATGQATTPSKRRSLAEATRPAQRQSARPKRRLAVSHRAMLVDGDDEAFRHVLYLMVLASARLATFREAVGRMLGLTGSQYVVFLAAAHAQGEHGVTIRDLARYVLMASTHVTTQVGALIRMGLLTKRPNGQDGRSVLVSLTQKGERAMDRISPIRCDFNDAFFVGIDRDTLLAVGGFLQRIVDNSERALPLLGRAEPRSSSGRRLPKERAA